MLTNVRSSTDPRTMRTRQLLMDAFTALFHERGFQALTVQDIAARATVNRATFYAHFDDKYALFAYATRRQFLKLVQQQVSTAALYSQEQLRQLVGSICTFLAELHQRCPYSFREFEPMVATEVVGAVEAIVATWAPQQKGARHQQSDRGLTTSVASWGMYGVVRDWIVGQRTESAEQFTERVIPLIAAVIER